MSEHVIMLDGRSWKLRLTQYALLQMREFYGTRLITEAFAAARKEPRMRMMAVYLWFLCVSDDRDLTPDKMGAIIEAHLGTAPARRFLRLAELATKVMKHLRDLDAAGVVEEK